MRGISIAFALSLVSCTDAADDQSQTEQDATTIKVLRGVDRASAFSVREAKILKNDHGVKWTGVYIGGACNAGSGWTRDRVSAIAQATHWRFMPIWVGQQSSAICGSHTLTYLRGRADGNAAAHRMHEMGWHAHADIPVALDVEGGTYSAHPKGSTSYVRGWVHAVHEAGYRAYVYSSPSGLEHFHDAKIGIDGGWIASWFFHGFHSVKPSGVHIGGRYTHHNRAWQYAGDFVVPGIGGVDGNVSDLLLAPKPGGTNRPTTRQREVPEGCELVPGEGLERGESVTSCDGRSVLSLDTEGELALTVDGAVRWTAGTVGAGATCVLSDTGELVVYDGDGEPVFTSDTGGRPDAHLRLDDGHLVLADDEVAWTSDSGVSWTDDARRDHAGERDADADAE